MASSCNFWRHRKSILDDKDMLRFLWLKDPFVLNSEVLHLQFCRLVFGLRPLPSILRATITYQLDSYKKRYPESVKLIKDSLYVDGSLADASDVQEGFESYQQSKELIARVPLTCSNGIRTQLVCFNSSITKRNLWCNRRQRNQVNQLKRKMNPLQSPLLVQIKCLEGIDRLSKHTRSYEEISTQVLSQSFRPSETFESVRYYNEMRVRKKLDWDIEEELCV